MTAIEFYDSAPGIFPQGAQYAALYADGDFNQGGQFGHIPNRRWISVIGGAAAAAYAGIVDFEQGNPVFFTPNALHDWAFQRKSAGHRFRVYSDRSNVHAAFQQVASLDPEWWIATDDNNPHWTPALIVASVRAISGVTLSEQSIWGIQWGSNNRYDTSYLTGQW